ncbi:Multimeric flavodoxin WrbA [Butyrivibrio fibrisolvens DSM 3071]|uniref:Multimeric flavodoxin WrbA n=1 Tax=Butyrivibrio fibrisolvens DSM 3071 TaxID=1121131 RepID=A0A1M5Q3N8_BUTFI|nr:flavodoxin family protein [Butyrivibrio fibrisolvens]SHH08658.1 Multimeric flavodoxin WrbA [Butyrivibrio fibrisolvens DSM 3071]
MKQIFVLIGSRQKNGNTYKFVKSIEERMGNSYVMEYAFPQDYRIEPCIGCNTCFSKCKCVANDELINLQNKILKSDVFVIASPVYLHYFTADLKLILDKCSWWAHTLRLQGKPTVILSTCNSNGNKTVIKALGEIITGMGGNIIATSNAAVIPNQINNEEWLDEVASQISERIKEYAELPPQSNKDIEKVFDRMKQVIKLQREYKTKLGIDPGEYNYWKNMGMLNYQTFSDYLEKKNTGGCYVESEISAAM